QSDRAPLSCILPQLYLGAESDVTQDCLSARGISYVLSVSRCCPQPSFLPQSQYLRIPIDDSLRDDLLPWIPEAVRFIDSAMSLGCSVLVHCAAGISRSPALAVAYVMYSRGMDLDHAYRFVKERRPTISPNFNFLGQLQLFQHTLPLQNADANAPTQPITSPVTHTQPDDCGSQDTNDDVHVTSERIQSSKVQPEFTLSLSDKLRTLSLSVDEQRRTGDQTETHTLSHTHTPTLQKPTHLHVQSLSEKRKSLTLSLIPICPASVPHTDQQREILLSVPRHTKPYSSPSVHKEETKVLEKEPNQSPVSPVHLTINSLLGWGERMLLGVLLGPHIKVGHVSLPYSC
ncbi:dual specificity protein phosphatase 16-like, partial [Silurus asotus]